MVRALVGDSTMTSVRPPLLNARTGADPFTRFTAGARSAATAAAALVAFGALAAFAALAFVAFFAGAFFLPGGVRVAIDLRT